MLEKTFGIVKPHILLEGKQFEILDLIEKKLGEIVFIKICKLSHHFVERFYEEHKEKSFFPEMVKKMAGHNLVIFIVEGDNVVASYRELMGKTDPKDSPEGSLRKSYGKDLDYNAVHGSDSVTSASREIELLTEFKLI